MTAAVYNANSFNGDTGGGAFTVNRTTRVESNYWLIYIIGCTPSGGQVGALPSEVQGTLYSSDILKIGYRLASAEPTTYSFSTTGGANPRAAMGVVLAYKGGDPLRPPTVGAIISGSDTIIRSPATDVPFGATIRAHIGFAYDSVSSAAVGQTAPLSMKERVDEDQGSSTGGDVAVVVAVFDEFVNSGPGQERQSTLSRSMTATIGIQLFIYQTPITKSEPLQPNESIETLLELTHQDETTGLDTTKLYSGRRVVFTGGEHYKPRMLNSPEIEQRASDAVVFGGVIATTISAIRLDNKDGELDAIYAYGLALGRDCIVKIVFVTDENASDLGAGVVGNAETVFSGIVAAMTPDGTTMIVQLSDRTALLDVPLQVDLYDGTTGFGGGTENEGLTQPLLFGRCFNLLPAQLGTISGRETYQIHSRTLADVTHVYIRGIVQVDSTPVAPTVGEFRILATDGSFELGSAPDGVVTASAKGDATYAYVNNHGEIIALMMGDFGPRMSESYINYATFSLIDAYMSGEIGIYFPLGDRTPARWAIEQVVVSGGIWISGGHDGKVRMATARPGPADILYLTEPDIVELRPVALPANLQPAPREISMFTERNWYQVSDFATGVTASNRRKLSGPGRTVVAASEIIAARQLIDRHWDIIDGLWFDDSDGRRTANQMRVFVEQGLISFRVTTDRYRGVVELGMRVEIESYGSEGIDYGLFGGFTGIVTGYREIPSKGRTIMTLIGSVPGGIELREEGGYELREDGTLELRE